MKISIVTTIHYNDDNRVFKKEIHSLLKSGAQILYFAPGEMIDDIDGLEYINVNLLGNNKLRKFSRIFKILKKSKVQVVHFHDPELMLLGLALKILTKIKVFYDVHEDYPSDILNKAYLNRIKKVFYFIIIKILEFLSNIFFDGIITADEKVLKRFNKKKSIVIFNYPILKQYESVNIVKYEERTYDMVYAGMLTENMVLNIINSTKYVVNKGINLQVLLVSPFNFNGGITKVISYLHNESLSGNFTLSSRVPPDEIPHILSISKIGVIPLENTEKMRKNIPTKLFEYMISGNIIVANDLPPIRTYDNDGSYVIYCNTSSEIEFGEAIIKALQITNYEYLARLMKDLVLSKYNWSIEEKKLVDFYDRSVHDRK